MKNSTNAIMAGVGWTIVLNLVNGLYGFISVPLLLNFYGKAEYGLIALAMSINVYLRLLDLGLNSTNVKFYSIWLALKNNNEINRLFKTSLGFYGIIGLLNCLILMILSVFVDSIFNVNMAQAGILRDLLQILAFSALLTWYSSSFNQIIMATENVAWVQKITIFPKILQLFIVGLVYLFEINLVLYFFLATFAIAIIIPLEIKKIKNLFINIAFTPSLDIGILKQIIPYCISIFSFSLFQFSQEALRPVFIGIRLTSDYVTEYKIIGSVVTLALMIGGSFMTAVLPSASKATAVKNRNAIEKIAYKGTFYISIILAFCVFGLISINKELIIVYVGKEYLHLSNWLCLWLLCILSAHNQAISSIILAGEDIRPLTYSSMVASVTCLTLCWELLPVVGIGAAILGYTGYVLIQFLFYYLYYWRVKLQLNTMAIFINSFMKPVIVGALSWCIVLLVFKAVIIENAYLMIFVKGIIFSTIYVIVLYYFLLNNEDKQFIKNNILSKCQH